MSDLTVQALAKSVGLSIEQMMHQLKEAKIPISSPDHKISAAEKSKLLAHLQQGKAKTEVPASVTPKKITLSKKSISALRVDAATGAGKAKTVSVEVRKKRTIIRPEDIAALPTAEPSPTSQLAAESIAEPIAESGKTIETGSTPQMPAAEIPAAPVSAADKLKEKPK